MSTAAAENSSTATQLLGTAQGLASRSGHLADAMQGFVKRVRAA